MVGGLRGLGARLIGTHISKKIKKIKYGGPRYIVPAPCGNLFLPHVTLDFQQPEQQEEQAKRVHSCPASL